MIQLISTLISEVSGVLQSGIAVAAIAWVAIVWWRSKALVSTISAIMLAGVVVWATANVDFLKSRVAEDATGTGRPSQTQPISGAGQTVNDLLGF